MEKITKYEKKILSYESKFNKFKKINKSELEKFNKELFHYKTMTKLLLTDPNFYSTLKFIELDKSDELVQYNFQEIIWIHEHYEHIEKIRSIESDIKLLLVESNKLGLISSVQFRLAKKILNFIDIIYKSDIILKDFYNEFNNDKINKIKNIKQLNQSHLDLFFNIIEIIILKIFNIEKELLNKSIKSTKSTKIDLLLENKDYLNNISKFKNLLEKLL